MLNDVDLLELEQKKEVKKILFLNRKAHAFVRHFFQTNRLRLFASHLVRLLEGGIPLLRALELIEQENRDENYKAVLQNVREEIRQGLSFSEALGKNHDFFPAFFTQAIHVGEISGSMDKVLNLLSRHLQRTQDSQRKMAEALAYPLFLVTLGFVTLAILLKFVVPRISGVYEGLGGQLPAMTRFILAISQLFFPIVLIVATALAGLIYFSLTHREKIFLWILRMPWLGALVRDAVAERLFSLLHLLLEGGVPLLQALAVTAPAGTTNPVQRDLLKVREAISQGAFFSEGMREMKWLNETTLALIRSGEESGKLSGALLQISEEARYGLESRSELMMQFLEPVLILVIGAVIGFIAMAVLLPVLEMNEWIR